jgi:hypothetical protein
MRYKSGLVLAVLAGVFGLIALPMAAARADTTTVLSVLGSFHQIVADTADGYLFFSEGPGSDSLLTEPNDSSPLIVTNLTGTVVATIDNGDGVEGLALDGGTLYAALAGTDQVAAIEIATIKSDPSSPTQTMYPLATGDVPYSLAVQSGKVWVSYNVGTTAGTAAIGDINLSASTPSSAFEPATAGPSTWYSAPGLAADPDPTGTTLLAYQGDSNPAAAATFSTTTDPATPISAPGNIGSAGSGTACGGVSQVAVVPGGAGFAASCGGHQVNVYSTQDVTKPAGTSYATPGGGPAAVAIAPDGTVAVGALGTTVINAGNNTGDVAYVYSPGGGTAPRNIFDFAPGYSNEYEAGGLAWAADGSELFAVVYAYGASGTSGTTWNVVLQTFREPETTRATLTLGGTSSADIGKSVTITGTLQLGTGNPPASTPVTITRTLAGTATKRYTVKTGAKGAFSLTDKPTVLGTYAYTASYAGNSTTQAATRTRAVTITRIPTSLTLTTSKTISAYKATVTITAHLGATYAGRTVTIYAQPFGSSAKREIKSGRVNSKGYLTAYYSPASSTTFSAYFGGDARYTPKTVTRDVYVGAGVSMSISGYYTSEYIGSTLYRVFHHTATLDAPVTVSPNKHGECVEMEIQEYYNGTWYANGITGCGTLSSASKVTWHIGLTHATGGQFRMRADYIRSSADRTNLNADSSWYYFIVVS